jgi:putative membrane protein
MQAMQIAGATVPSSVTLPPDKSEMVRRLQAADGTAFDRLYLSGQIAGQQELPRLHTDAAQHAASPGERMISIVAVPGVRTHMAMLQTMDTQMRG